MRALHDIRLSSVPRIRKGSLCSCVTGSSDPELFVSEVIVSRMGPGTYRVFSKHGIEERSLVNLSKDLPEAGPGTCVFIR